MIGAAASTSRVVKLALKDWYIVTYQFFFLLIRHTGTRENLFFPNDDFIKRVSFAFDSTAITYCVQASLNYAVPPSGLFFFFSSSSSYVGR